MSSMIAVLFIFVSGAFSALFISSHEYIKAFIVAIFGLILMLSVIKSLEARCNELIIKKLCYIYVLLDMCQGAPTVMKAIKRILKELALDACGVGQHSYWLKWEAYWRNRFKEKEDGE